MKKLVLAILSLGMLLSSANAACQGWEHGQVVPGGGQPNGSTAPKPYCWQATNIKSMVFYEGNLYHPVAESLYDKSETFFNYLAYDQRITYGESYFGRSIRPNL